MLGEARAGARKPRTASRLVAALVLGLVAIVGFGAATAHGAGGESRSSIVVHSVHSRPHLRAFWTAKRIRQAEPLSVLTFSKPGGRVVEAGVGSPAAADRSAHGTDTGDSNLFPNSANGIVLFFYGPDEYQCSGSVVNTSAGNVVLTAGHCVIDPGPGTSATNIVFIPGHRDGAEPVGEWPATSFATTPQWQSTAGTGNPNDADEAGDMAMLTLANRPSDSATIQSVVGAVGIAFNQARSQTYMQYGYPAEFPYDGTRLYENTSSLFYNDPNFSPSTMGISSDFTPGCSGGPWLVGSSPVAMSVSDYSYGSLPGYMFGPYFGSIAQNLFVRVGGSSSGSSATGAISNGSPAKGTAPPTSAPPNAFGIQLLRRNRHRGFAVLGVDVPGAGALKLNGHGLRRVIKQPGNKGTVALPVRAKGSKLATLRDAGRVLVQARIAYTPTAGDPRVKFRDLVLLRHD
jgi:V8-like Glu-specific endopeptidase